MNRLVQLMSNAAISSSIPGVALRHSLRCLSKLVELPLDVQVALNLSRRPSYAYCAYHAAVLAKRLGLESLSLIEFGVAGGNGLTFLDEIAEWIERRLRIGVQVYGFDSGKGLPVVELREDLPYWYQTSQYRMDPDRLREQLTRSTLVLGNVRDTVKTFFEQFRPAPIGAIFEDLDLFSSTADSFGIFETNLRNFLPRVFMYFDDVIGTEIEMFSDAVGELHAIKDFNACHRNIHISLNRNLLPRYDVPYRYQIYYAHLMAHPLYTSYVGAREQGKIEAAVRLGAAA